ncbi:hypothetical protein TcG_03103 [Trypanosoma cruzi]|uniref:Uncharacterized protein n=1 Tax=Trypanosoma cruzi Dm28c TaxID=1416333 RepID=V5BCZ0_TRYCR|nr:hypothetical protein TCDM_06042 [Trypanosoma cruzi Dm28c]RNF21782.1 hypothetical protein TcG_03103 [Trypanosoma cruzi]
MDLFSRECFFLKGTGDEFLGSFGFAADADGVGPLLLGKSSFGRGSLSGVSCMPLIPQGDSSLSVLFWWWNWPMPCADGGCCGQAQEPELDSSVVRELVLELTVSRAMRELLRVYTVYDPPRAALMLGDSVDAYNCLFLGRCERGDPILVLPVEEDWNEAVRRGILPVVILRFTLWAYVTRLSQRCCDVAMDADLGAFLSSARPATCDALSMDREEVMVPLTAGRGKHTELHEAGLPKWLPLPLPQFIPGVPMDRSDWLEVLAVFAPPDCAATLLQRARSVQDGRYGEENDRGASSFLSWRHAGPVNITPIGNTAGSGDGNIGNEATVAMITCDVSKKSARHGLSHLRAILQAPRTPTQVFLFHGELHVLHHLDGVVRCMSEAPTTTNAWFNCSGEGVLSGGTNADGPLSTISCVNAAPESCHDEAFLSPSQYKEAAGRAVSIAAWRSQGGHRQCVQREMPNDGNEIINTDDSDDNHDDDMDAIVEYAEALLLPSISTTRNFETHGSGPCLSSGYENINHDDMRPGHYSYKDDGMMKAAHSVPHGVLAPIATSAMITCGSATPSCASFTANLPGTLISVGGGAFCLPRTVLQDKDVSCVLAYWGFDPVVCERSDCTREYNRNGEDTDTAMAATPTFVLNDNEDCVHNAVSCRLPLSKFTAQLSCNILFCREIPTTSSTAGCTDDENNYSWWPVDVFYGGADDATSDDDDYTDCGVAPQQFVLPRRETSELPAAPILRPLV